MERHVLLARVFLGRGLGEVGGLDEVCLDHGALRGWHTERFPEPFFVAKDAVGENFGVQDRLDAALPDLALFIESLCLAELLHVRRHAQQTEQPASHCESITRSARVVEALGRCREYGRTVMQPELEGLTGEVGTELLNQKFLEIAVFALAKELPDILVAKSGKGSDLELEEMVLRRI